MNDTTIPPLKRCTKCGEAKPINKEYFPANKKMRCGFDSICKQCKSKQACEYYQRKKQDADWLVNFNKHHREYMADKHATNPEWSAKKKQHDRDYWKNRRENDPEFNQKRRPKRNVKRENELRAIRRANDPQYRQYQNEAMRKRRAAKPEYWRLLSRIHAAKRRARLLANGGTHTVADIMLAYRSQKGCCWHCGKKLGKEWHDDHLTPISKGGSNDARNIVLSCAFCNVSKGDKFCWEWNGRLL